MKCVPDIMRAKSVYGNDELAGLAQLEKRVLAELDALAKEHPR
jgi:hypothetical protein